MYAVNGPSHLDEDLCMAQPQSCFIKGHCLKPAHLLIINPNTTFLITALLETHARSVAGPDADIRSVTARFGAPYIACEASYAVAGHAVLDAWAAATASGEPAAGSVLIGCFGDPGLLALRETSSVPVTGLAEASFIEAAAYGRFAVVTGGVRWKPMLERLAYTLGFSESLAGIHAIAPSGAWLAEHPEAALALLAEACRLAVRDFNAQAVILGGAGLAGLAARIQPAINVPLIDSVLSGARHALLRAREGRAQGSGRFDLRWKNLPAELTNLGLPMVENLDASDFSQGEPVAGR